MKLSLTSAPAMTGSTWLRWLKMNTAGRCAVRFSLPSTLRLTPVAVSSVRPNVEVKKLTPVRLLRVSRPRPTAPAAIGTIEPTPATRAQLRHRAAAAAAAESQHRPARVWRHGGQLARGIGRPRIADQVHQRDVLVAVGVEVALRQVDAVLGGERLHRPGLARAPR